MEALGSSEASRRYLERVDLDRISELIDMSDVLARSSVEEYKMLVSSVLDAAFRRDTFRKLKDCQALCYNQSERDIEQKIYSVLDDVMMEFSTTNDIPQYKDVVDDYWEQIKARQADGYAGIPFKFPALNEFATIERGELFVFAAEAKQGKSMMLLNCAVDLMRQGYAVLYLDSELNTRLFTARLISHLTEIDFKRITSGRYSGEESERIDRALAWLKEQRFTHLYIPMFDQQSIYTAVKKVKHTQGLDVLIVDYFKDSSEGDAYGAYQELGRLVDLVKNQICGRLGHLMQQCVQKNSLNCWNTLRATRATTYG